MAWRTGVRAYSEHPGNIINRKALAGLKLLGKDTLPEDVVNVVGRPTLPWMGRFYV